MSTEENRCKCGALKVRRPSDGCLRCPPCDREYNRMYQKQRYWSDPVKSRAEKRSRARVATERKREAGDPVTCECGRPKRMSSKGVWRCYPCERARAAESDRGAPSANRSFHGTDEYREKMREFYDRLSDRQFTAEKVEQIALAAAEARIAGLRKEGVRLFDHRESQRREMAELAREAREGARA